MVESDKTINILLVLNTEIIGEIGHFVESLPIEIKKDFPSLKFDSKLVMTEDEYLSIDQKYDFDCLITYFNPEATLLVLDD